MRKLIRIGTIGIISLLFIMFFCLSFCEINGKIYCVFQKQADIDISIHSSTDYQDLEKINKLYLLKELNYTNIYAKNIIFVKNAPKLETFIYSGTSFYDIDYSVINELKNLKNLTIHNLDRKDLTFFTPNNSIEQFWVLFAYSGNNLNGIENLQSLKQLIIVSGINLSDISSLKNNKLIKELQISCSKVADISCLSCLTNLEKIYLEDNTQITDISCLNKLTNVKVLNISNTSVSDISVIKNMPLLEELDISKTKTTDISPIFEFENLKKLGIDEGMLTNEDLTKLREMGVKVKLSYE